VSYQSVAAYLVFFVKNTKGSTKSVDSVRSALKVSSYYVGGGWLTDAELYQLNGVIKVLEYKDLVAVVRKRPITLTLLARIVKSLDLHSATGLLIGMAMTLCHDGLLRSGELFRGLTVSSIEWHQETRGFTLFLPRSKANRRGGGEYIKILDYDGCSSYKLVRKFFNRWGLWSAKDAYLIPRVVRGELDFSQSSTTAWWREVIKERISIIGLDPAGYSGHSFRAGGATDLFVRRVPYNVIKSAGRWKSDVALRYYRDDQDVARTVASAFGGRFMRDY
jgi:hypothetical protein